MTDSSIVESVNKAGQDTGDEKIPVDTVPVMTRTEGLAVLNYIALVLHYIEQTVVTSTDMMLLRQWHDITAQNRGSIWKQKSVECLF